jgi:Mannosyl-glycoprotein endo-beta-N-acetylglucosaminidase
MATKVNSGQLQKLSATHQSVSASVRATASRARETTNQLKLERSRHIAVKAVPLRVQATVGRVNAKATTIITRSVELTKRADYVQQQSGIASEVRAPVGRVAMPLTTASVTRMRSASALLSGRVAANPRVSIVKPKPSPPTPLRRVPRRPRTSVPGRAVGARANVRGPIGLHLVPSNASARVVPRALRSATIRFTANQGRTVVAPRPPAPPASPNTGTVAPTAPRTRPVVAPRPPSPADRFRSAIARDLTAQLGAHGVPASAIPAFVAQIDLETAAGTSRSATTRNNFAGIRGAQVTPQNTRGYRSYATPEAGVAAYVSLITRLYPNVLDAARTGDPYATATAMGNSRWATGHYRLGVRGDEDRVGDAGGVVGRVGTEGQALYPAIRRAISAITPPVPAPLLPGETRE